MAALLGAVSGACFGVALVLVSTVWAGRSVTKLPVRWTMTRERSEAICESYVRLARAGMDPTLAWKSAQHEIGALLHSWWGPTDTVRVIHQIYNASAMFRADQLDRLGEPDLAAAVRRRWADDA